MKRKNFVQIYDYLFVLVMCSFCAFSSLICYIYIKDCHDHMKAQMKDYVQVNYRVDDVRREVRELKAEVKDCRQEQDVITDCLLNKRWD